jgi:hypothetical protein
MEIYFSDSYEYNIVPANRHNGQINLATLHRSCGRFIFHGMVFTEVFVRVIDFKFVSYKHPVVQVIDVFTEGSFMSMHYLYVKCNFVMPFHRNFAWTVLNSHPFPFFVCTFNNRLSDCIVISHSFISYQFIGPSIFHTFSCI